MKILRYRVQFLTPAFLGDAEQSGRWRTPPFKALLRQWWRVVWAADHNFHVSIEQMRREEGLLFGNAWLQDEKGDANFRKSQVRIRLNHWNQGQLRSWQGLEVNQVPHPEVQRTDYWVGPHAYLGYGPLGGSAGTKLMKQAAIDSGETAELALCLSENCEKQVTSALALMSAYGTVGSRSRNGWGSFEFSPADGTPPLPFGREPARNFQDSLKLDWPHAIGSDEKGLLVWRTASSSGSWRDAMRALAILRIAIRTQFRFPNAEPPHDDVLDRHWLSYPITRHSTKIWPISMRLPNSLRFKVRSSEDPQKLTCLVYHMPCSPPPRFKPDHARLIQVWRQVHKLLDELCKPAEERKFDFVQNQAWIERVRPQLSDITLSRAQGGQR